jgi:4-hydroxythreonine-4-phosphate dehydrogenase
MPLSIGNIENSIIVITGSFLKYIFWQIYLIFPRQTSDDSIDSPTPKKIISLKKIYLEEKSMKDLPIIGITMGDPSGIGPEIIVKALSDPEIYSFCRPVILGDPGVLSFYLKDIPDMSIKIKEIADVGKSEGVHGLVDLVPLSRLKSDSALPGNPTKEGGKAMAQYIIAAVEMAMEGKIFAMVTCPINKALMNKAGYNFEGHTQLIAHLTSSTDYVMMLAGEKLRVTLVTIHCALKEVPFKINKENILKTIRVTHKALKDDFGIENPRIAVAALNPHGGEGGLFGSEESKIILPAVNSANKQGYNVSGPLPADTLYSKAVSGEFDAVVNMYHDQGLIPLKLLHFSDAVNVTLGLPIIRTSVDHGTAYDIAGKGVADPNSLKAAIRMAAEMIKNRRRAKGSR